MDASERTTIRLAKIGHLVKVRPQLGQKYEKSPVMLKNHWYYY